VLTINERLQDFNENAFRAALLDWVAASNQPLTEPTNEWFVRVQRVLNPDAPVVSSDMLRYDIPREVDRLEGIVKGLLEVSVAPVPASLPFGLHPFV